MLVKVTPDLNDLLVGHTTWWTYTAMTRIYKHYNFELHGSQYKAHLTSMSSYPGMVSSMVSELPCGNPISRLCSWACEATLAMQMLRECHNWTTGRHVLVDHPVYLAAIV